MYAWLRCWEGFVILDCINCKGRWDKIDLASKWIVKKVIISFTCSPTSTINASLFIDAANGNAAESDRNSRALSWQVRCINPVPRNKVSKPSSVFSVVMATVTQDTLGAHNTVLGLFPLTLMQLTPWRRHLSRNCQCKMWLFFAMAHDDLRVEWLKRCVSAGFDLTDCDCFDELLSRNDGEAEEKIIRYLNVVTDEDSSICLMFFLTITEEETEIDDIFPGKFRVIKVLKIWFKSSSW